MEGTFGRSYITFLDIVTTWYIYVLGYAKLRSIENSATHGSWFSSSEIRRAIADRHIWKCTNAACEVYPTFRSGGSFCTSCRLHCLLTIPGHQTFCNSHTNDRWSPAVSTAICKFHGGGNRLLSASSTVLAPTTGSTLEHDRNHAGHPTGDPVLCMTCNLLRLRKSVTQPSRKKRKRNVNITVFDHPMITNHMHATLWAICESLQSQHDVL